MRTVLKNDVNEISVCVDRKRDTGVFYTVISISSRDVCRFLVQHTTQEGLFESNTDYVGSFTYRDQLNLVFIFREESLLSSREDVYLAAFAKRKETALQFLAACAETGITGCVGELLMDKCNINLSATGKIYFNYFMDFKNLAVTEAQSSYYRKIALFAYDIVSREYKRKYDGEVSDFPSEIQVFYKKAQGKGLTSYGQILAFLRELPDEPVEKRVGIGRLLDKLLSRKAWLSRYGMTVFVVGMVLATIAYTCYQISVRVSIAKSQKENTTYIGMQTIGEVYLGEEDV